MYVYFLNFSAIQLLLHLFFIPVVFFPLGNLVLLVTATTGLGLCCAIFFSSSKCTLNAVLPGSHLSCVSHI